jgi:plasmid maintenance system antidote protein VapI
MTPVFENFCIFRLNSYNFSVPLICLCNKFKTKSFLNQIFLIFLKQKMADFSDHIVNQRFKNVYETLEHENLIRGKSDIAKKLGTYNHVINSILKGQRNITVDQMHKLFEIYAVNANYMFGLTNDMFLPGSEHEAAIPTHAMGERYQAPKNNITLYPHRALAGDAIATQDTDQEALPTFSVPGLSGQLIAIRISGDSMYPNLTSGDIVICEPVERDTPLRENHVYVIVTDAVVAKRIQVVRGADNEERLRLISDNDSVYKPYEIDLDEIRQILKVKARLTDYAIS